MSSLQFQTGVTIREFLSRFGTKAQCAEVIKRSRWRESVSLPTMRW